MFWLIMQGDSLLSRFFEMTEEEWDVVMDINLKGTFFLCKAVLAKMMRADTEKLSMFHHWRQKEAVSLLVSIMRLLKLVCFQLQNAWPNIQLHGY